MTLHRFCFEGIRDLGDHETSNPENLDGARQKVQPKSK